MYCVHWKCVANVESTTKCAFRLVQRDLHPTLSWQDAGMLAGCMVLSDDESTEGGAEKDDDEAEDDVQILEEPTMKAIRNQVVSGIRLIRQGLRMQEQGLEMVEVAVKGSAIEDLPNIMQQMMHVVSI